ncbi:hypothetical protein WG66_013456 [Moniliophthora roreri]|nr:hypothetical protein WG66_013456 [Moniliophthora roreri]
MTAPNHFQYTTISPCRVVRVTILVSRVEGCWSWGRGLEQRVLVTLVGTVGV